MTNPHERILKLGFESIESIPHGVNEVRVYVDPILDCFRAGKRVDISIADPDTVPEAKSLQAISHPNIVPIVTAAEVSGYDPAMRVIEIVTPYFDRGSITDALLRGEHFTGPEALAIMRSSLLGLRELHTRHRICHRDIKSGNILLDKSPVFALIADLGIAGRFRADGTVPAANNPTLYSPPELLTTGSLSEASDLYGMGLVLRELLGGNFPYARYSRKHVEESLLRGEPPLSQTDLELPIWAPSSIKKVYRKATQLHPTNRYQNAKDLASALNNCWVGAWEHVDEGVWEASRDRGMPASVRVEITSAGKGVVAALKRRSGVKWRRPSGHSDVLADTLKSKGVQSVFDAANAFTR